MPYTKYIDDADPYTPVATDPITYQQANEIQDQSRRILGPREISLMHTGIPITTGWSASAVAKSTLWLAGVNSASIIFPIRLPVGAVIYGGRVTVSGNSGGATGGNVELQVWQVGAGAYTTSADFHESAIDLFATGGLGYASSETHHLTTSVSGMPITVQSGYFYRVAVVAASDAAANQSDLHYLSIIASMGTATNG